MVRIQDGEGYGDRQSPRAPTGPGGRAAPAPWPSCCARSAPTAIACAHTGTTRYVDGRVPLPAFALSAPDAEQLERIVALGQTPRVRLLSAASYRAGRALAERHRRGARQRQAGGVRAAGRAPGQLGPGHRRHRRRRRHRHHRRRRQAHRATCRTGRAAPCAWCCSVPRRSPSRTRPVGAFGGNSYADRPPVGARAPRARRRERPGLRPHLLAVALPPAVVRGEFGQATDCGCSAPLGVLPSRTRLRDAGTDVGPRWQGGRAAFALNQDATHYFDLHHTADDTLDKVDRAQLDQNVAAWAALRLARRRQRRGLPRPRRRAGPGTRA